MYNKIQLNGSYHRYERIRRISELLPRPKLISNCLQNFFHKYREKLVLISAALTQLNNLKRKINAKLNLPPCLADGFQTVRVHNKQYTSFVSVSYLRTFLIVHTSKGLKDVLIRWKGKSISVLEKTNFDLNEDGK